MRDVHFKNLAKFYSSVTKEEVYFKNKSNQWDHYIKKLYL